MHILKNQAHAEILESCDDRIAAIVAYNVILNWRCHPGTAREIIPNNIINYVGLLQRRQLLQVWTVTNAWNQLSVDI